MQMTNLYVHAMNFTNEPEIESITVEFTALPLNLAHIKAIAW